MKYKKHQTQYGFSLIELMVVIAIIGILSSIIYVSFSGVRNKAADEDAKQGLALTLVQAKLYYFYKGESFSGVCDPSSVDVKVKSINEILVNAGKSVKITDTVNTGEGNGNRITCHSGKNYWVAQVPLRGSTLGAPKMFCADSKGVQKEQSQALGQGDTSCN